MASKPAAAAAQRVSSGAQSPQDGPEQAGQGVGGALAARGSNALALPPELAAEFAAEAQDAAAKERPSISRLSLRSGILSFAGEPVKERFVDSIILWGTIWHKFYEGRFDPNNIVNPTCFAVGEDEAAEMRPHENVENPPCGEAGTCASCPKFQWGTAMRDGVPSRGKACKETRRLVMIPRDALADPESVLKAELALMDVPVTSLKVYASFVNMLSVTMKRPAWTVVTRIEVVPDLKTQLKLQLTPVDVINNPAILSALKEKREQAKRAAVIPYDETYLQGEGPDPAAGEGAAPSGNAKFRART